MKISCPVCGVESNLEINLDIVTCPAHGIIHYEADVRLRNNKDLTLWQREIEHNYWNAKAEILARFRAAMIKLAQP